ncbi:DEAD/DEAH box helicase [Litorisediminicola beolgyonensis]|uniref:DEAD/DEAH box helicase n=1 Tax=Litorisediminicola beolgyonensis TaxID=1173614 RepID=A0ABW3ZEU9_9RHOB
MHPALRAALDERGYTTLTPVQTLVLDPDLKGRDMLVSAQTGSGKTLGFGLAIAPTLLGEDTAFGPAGAPLAVVIAPTRELALQVKRELTWLFAKTGAVLASCVGGMDMRDERRALERGAHIVAATPGRLRDHIARSSIDLSAVRAVVLDEADEMLDLGFREDLEFILGELPSDRQTLLFSATVPRAIADLAKGYQTDAERIIAKSDASQHGDIEYRAMMVAAGDVDNAVINTLRFHEAPNALVFANTRAMVNRLAARLSNRGFSAVALSGELSQSERTHALQAMRDGRAQVCVATDVAARGIDLPKLDLVVHAELPSNQETLLHRSGRTGRAGRKGVSALVVTPATRKKAERLLGWAKVRAEWGTAPSANEVREMDEERLFSDPSWEVPATEAEEESAARLLEAFSPEQIAAGYLRLLRTLRAPPEELADINAKPEPRPEFGASTWFSVSGGRNAGAEPRRLLPMLCKAGGLTKDDVGAIRVQNDESFVQLRDEAVAGFLNRLGAAMELEEGARVTQLSAPPELASRGPGPRKEPSARKPMGAKPYRSKPAVSAPREADPKPAPDRPRAFPKDAPRKDRDRTGEETGRPAKRAFQKGAASKIDRVREGEKTDRPAKPAFRKTAGPKDDRRRGSDETGGGEKRPFRKSTAPKEPWSRSGDETGGNAKPKRTPKGPPPPKGKPNSKKNRARAAADAPGKGPGKVRSKASDPSQSLKPGKPRRGRS